VRATRRPGQARERGAHQLAFTVRRTVSRDRLPQLRQLLAEMAAPRGGTAPRIPFDQLTGVHFARLLLLDDVVDREGRTIGASLVYMSEVDAPLERHLAELCTLAAPALDAAFGLCTDYPDAPDAARRRRFLCDNRVRAQAVYVNALGRTREQILREDRLHRAIEEFLDRERNRLPAEAPRVRAAIQRFVESDAALAWARRRAPAPSLRHRVAEAVHLVSWTVALLLLAPLALALLVPFVLVLRLHERRDEPELLRPDPDHARALGEIEDFGAQNQFSAVGFIKPGPFRRGLIAVVLFLIDFAARHVYVRGSLAGVKTIHFARWVVLDDRRRAIFTSNYDGSLENYMDDFIDKVAFGLNASFSNGVGYPRTRFLFFSGARREDEFKDHLRRRQIPTQVWYSAYQHLTLHNIENNALIRSGLFGTLSEPEVAAWLRRL